MRLLVVSHPCVTPINQDFFGAVAEHSGWEVTILVPNRWRNEYGEQRPARSPQFRHRLCSLRTALPGNIPLHFYVSDLRARVRELRPDVAYLHHEPYGVATAEWAAALAQVPFAFYSAQNIVKQYALPIRLGERLVYRRADLALPISDDVAQVLRTKGYRGRSTVLPLPVDLHRFAPAYRRPGVPVVGYVGRLSPEKGVDVLLRAVALSATSSLRCVVAGTGPDEERLKLLARDLGVEQRVEWLGYVDHFEVADVYRRCTLLAVPSLTVPNWKEQFGRVVIEALACGVGVVTSDSGELPRLISTTGGGWTVPEGDPHALAACIDQRIREDSDTQAEVAHGRRNVLEMFGLDAVAVRFTDALGHLVRRPAP